MTTWTSGYVADIGYTYGYYNELNPQRVRLAFLNAGLAFPEIGTACELGFGQGLSANIHASASTCSWWGTDFNPAQAGFAQELASVSGSGAQLFDESFAEFSSRNLPEFDYIGLHGIWSWISDENRAVIVDFIRRKLKVGGVLYISYNTLPGWGAFAPMRHLMTEHAEVIGSAGRGIVSRINDAIDFTERLLSTNPLYARANPQIAERIKKLKEHNRHYLAHEYFNRDWHPMHFATMAQWLEPAKLQFACSANYVDHVEALNLTPEQQVFLNEIPDAMFRQTVRDFMVNQQFRKDYWVKGARRVNALQQSQALMQQRVILSSQAEDIKLTVQGAVGEAKLSDGIYTPIIQALADHEPHSVQDLINVLQGQESRLMKVVQALLVLTAQGHVYPVQAEEATSKAAATTKKLNQHLLNLAKGSADVSFLASPVTGGGIAVGRVLQLFLLSIGQGKTLPGEWVQDTWGILKSQGHRIVKAGQALQSDEENVAELNLMASAFQARGLPMLKGLKIT
jgi:SAM-dependent methyltransferase